MTPIADQLGTWVYAVTSAPCPRRLDGVTGIADEPVRAIDVDGLVAVVGSVSLDGFGDDGGLADSANVADLERLEAIARAHHRVVTVIAAAGPAVPFRLGTVYHHDGRVRELLTDRRAHLLTALHRLAGRTEWGVKGYLDQQVLSETTRSSGVQAGAATGPGTAYLLRRRAERRTRDELWQQAVSCGDGLHDRLSGLATGSRRLPLHDARRSTRQLPMVLNGAYLVEDERAEEFAAAVRTLPRVQPGVHLELTGPWPPYCAIGVDDIDDLPTGGA